jgi:hypothetical protein
MEIKNRIWMNGSLEWWCYIGEEEHYLGRREVPMPLSEGDRWTTLQGDQYAVQNGEIVFIGRTEPPEREW